MDPSDPSGAKIVYVRLKSVDTKAAIFETSGTNDFKSKKEFKLTPDKITDITPIGKRFRVLFAHKDSGVAIVWMGAPAGKYKGCSTFEAPAGAEVERI